MVEWHYKSKRKPSGGILKTLNRSDKKLSDRGGVFSATTIAKDEKGIRVDNQAGMGGKVRQKAKKVLFANIFDGKKGLKAKILLVLQNDANRLYTRRNIITKGAFIRVQIGDRQETAKVTSRPGQDGIVNAVIAKEPLKPKAEQKSSEAKTTAKKQKLRQKQEESPKIEIQNPKNALKQPLDEK